MVGGGVVPHYLMDEYFAGVQYPWSGVYYVGNGRLVRLCWMFLHYMLCAGNYLRLMWMDGEWVGVPMVPRLGFDDGVWPLAGARLCLLESSQDKQLFDRLSL